VSAYYPMLAVNIRLRFDEALHGLSVVAPQDVDEAAASLLPPASGGDLPGLLQGRSVDNLSALFNIVPRVATVELPGYRQTGKFSMTLAFRDMPIDPEILRSAGVEIYAGAIDAGQWGNGNTTPPGALGALRLSQLRTRDEAGRILTDNNLLIGLVDEITVEHSDQGSEVHLEGRDLRGVLLDTAVRPNAVSRIKLNRPIDLVVQQVLDGHPLFRSSSSAGRRVIVETNPDDWPDGVVPVVASVVDFTRIMQGAGGQIPGMPVQGDPHKLNFWDLITQFCTLVGAVPYFVGERLRLRSARSLYDPNKLSGFDPRFPTPFKGGRRRVVQGEQGPIDLAIRTLVYGRDLLKLKFGRKLQGKKTPTVEVVSVDTSSAARGGARLITVQWPAVAAGADTSQADVDKAATTSVAPSGTLAQKDVIYVSVPGVRSRKRLLQIAQDIREEIGRGEIGGSCSTKDLASLGGDSTDPDLLHIRPGDPVRFAVDARQLASYPPPISELSREYRGTVEDLAAELTKRLGDVNLARVVAYSTRGVIRERLKVYRVGNVRYSWSAKEGIGIDFDFQNYIESRSRVPSEKTRENRAQVVSRR
jgi:hypothetical protein